ncbi:molecular chaperone GrpE [Elusimicrobium simillimum]|uniref:nucleotide exchange factor GrpE n=1 Tax=Elusimicrobium simillimum TaxID=3143438 RepID=UPI003C6F6042
MKKHKEEEVEQVEEMAETQTQEPQQPDYYEQLVRLKAEFENYRKRTEKEKPELIAFGAQSAIASFLPIYDAMFKAEEEANKKGATAENMKKGLDMVFKEMKRTFEVNGVKPMDTMGKPYNHTEHEVLTTLPCETEDKDGVVTEEVQKGFKVGDRVLRHAKVCVGKFEPKDAPQEEAPEVTDEN